MIDPFPFVRPWLHKLDPELAHELTLRALEAGVVPSQPLDDDLILRTELFGRMLPHPVGLAAGFDKNARVYARMFAQGISFVEVGGVTPVRQEGNPRPRVFRLPEDAAVINRMGFPNEGADCVAARLRATDRLTVSGLVGVNLASNAASMDPASDFAALVGRFAPLADYLTLDISCPNTSNGRVFLDPTRLRELLARLRAEEVYRTRVPLVAKLSPDIDDALLERLVEVLLSMRIDAIIVSNTTTQRPGLRSRAGEERGGLSGRPLFESSTRMLAQVRRLTRGTVPLIGVGGIAGGEDAYAKIRAGACAVQLYTGLIYEGPALVTRIKRELAELLRRDGFAMVGEAVGRAVTFV